MGLREDLRSSIVCGDNERVQELTQQGLRDGLDPNGIVEEALIPAMDDVGQRFESGEFFLPEMLIAARAMKAGMAILEPYLSKSERKSAALVIIGTVQGDMHDIGKNIVAMMLQGAGLEVVDLGKDVSPRKFAEAVRSHNPSVLALSALLTTTMPQMGNTIAHLKQAGLREQVKIIVGGSPITPHYARKVGADGYGKDAVEAVAVVKRLLGLE